MFRIEKPTFSLLSCIRLSISKQTVACDKNERNLNQQIWRNGNKIIELFFRRFILCLSYVRSGKLIAAEFLHFGGIFRVFDDNGWSISKRIIAIVEWLLDLCFYHGLNTPKNPSSDRHRMTPTSWSAAAADPLNGQPQCLFIESLRDRCPEHFDTTIITIITIFVPKVRALVSLYGLESDLLTTGHRVTCVCPDGFVRSVVYVYTGTSESVSRWPWSRT